MQGFFGRVSKQIRLEVVLGARIDQIQPLVESRIQPTCQLHTDESMAYNRVATHQRAHQTVCHSKKEFARDEDGDGYYEVHCNSTEGLWTELRNFLRPFKGVSKKYLAQYVAIFENGFNARNPLAVVRALLIPNFFLEIQLKP